MSKYPISKEFFPFSHFTPPISEKFLAIAVPNMKTPKFIFKDKELDVVLYEVESYDSEKIEVFLISPKVLGKNAPCLVYLHGGGFVLAAAGYHYKNAMCYAAFCWAYENAETLGIDNTRMGIGGDSAGSTLAVGVCMMARDRKHPVKFLFQMLPYPFLDARNNSESSKKYTDTPMWNSMLSNRIAPMTKADKSRLDYVYYSPVEAENFTGLPPAYIETAEFDCLHDDGILYFEKLRSAGIDVTLNETKGTMHGFDIMQKASTTKSALEARIRFMKIKLSS